MIVIVDYNLGNIRSVENAFKKVGANISVSYKAEDIEAATRLVVPGVGAFKKAVANLKELKIYDPIIEYIKNKKPYLGICLGFQLLFTESLEHGKNPGFDILPGKVKRIKDKVKIPHMGWNSVYYSKDTPMFSNIPEGSYFYFDHSYYVDSHQENIVSGQTAYGNEFISAICRENIWGTQFHPEKSSDIGLNLLRNFLNYAS